jgi:hypothetical protein
VAEVDRIQEVEKRFQDRISEVQKTKDTAFRRSLLMVAMRENDLIFNLRKGKQRSES